jgi:branched-chain amino acid transport system substrate-binding protein
MHRFRTAALGLALLAASSGLTSCGDDGGGGGGGGGDDELTVGVIAPLTGPGQGFGVALATAAEVVADEINADGGLELDGKTYTLKVEKYDDEYTAEGTLAGYNELVKKKGIDVLVGPVGSAGGLAIKEKIEQDKLISMGDTYSPDMLDENTKYYFRINATSSEIAPALWKLFSENNPDATKLAIVGPDDATGQGGAASSTAAAEQFGIEVVKNVGYTRGTTDFNAAVTSLLSSEPDVIDLQTTPSQDAGLLLKAIDQANYDGLVLKTGGTSPAEISAVAGDSAEGLLFAQQCELESEAVQSYRKKYEEKTDVPFDPLSCEWHDGLTMGFAALEEAGSLDADAYVEAMEGIAPFDGPLKGELSWGGEDTYGVNHQILGQLWLYEIADGEPSQLGVTTTESP